MSLHLVPDHPSNQSYCPSCHRRFDTPTETWVMTDEGPMTQCRCPLCGYQFAQWPVAVAGSATPEEDADE